MMKKRLCLWMLLPMLLLGGCGVGNKMEDGFYTAEMAEYSHGWKEYLCIFVKNDKIVYAEFNARNESGYIKAWDNGYMGNMLAGTGTYPNAYTRAYVAQLVETQDPDEIDAVTGASHSGGNFDKLSRAVIEQAKKGDSSIVVVEE
ncbi:MAG: FMN-binding protein [Lachnospiraceae bacterium]|jgi:major membrane immunogen (membrane-anchored lipoprotein)|nr:FMN-binding protein [Lachnospiraceae bacterium]